MRNNPFVSVIVPTRNSIRTIEDTLKSIKNQTYKNTETIVVDQESTDGTLELAKKYTNKVLTNKPDSFYSAPPVSRNMGAKVSKGKYIFNIDSDMRLSKNLVEACVNKMEKDNKILALKVHEKDIGEGFWSRAKKLERRFYVGFDVIEAARFIRKSAFDRLGGYDESLRSAEDWDMSKRIESEGKIDDVKPFITHNLGKMSYWYQIKKKFDYGLTIESILKKHKFNTKKMTEMVVREVYFKNWKLFLQDPIGTLGFLILRPSELVAYVAGLIWARIAKVSI